MLIFVIISISAILITLCVRWADLKAPAQFTYEYYARTKQYSLDHKYKFCVRKCSDGYRCYIERTPSFRNRDTSKYMAHYWIEKGTNRHYVCWTGKIKYPEQAKTLCRNWSDATQQFIDTGIPAPGFERK